MKEEAEEKKLFASMSSGGDLNARFTLTLSLSLSHTLFSCGYITATCQVSQAYLGISQQLLSRRIATG